MEDNSVEKHLGRIRTRMADIQISELVKEHLDWDVTDLRMSSAVYFTESGIVTGNLYLAISEIAKKFAEFAIEQPLLNKYKNEHLLNSDPNPKRSVATEVVTQNKFISKQTFLTNKAINYEH